MKDTRINGHVALRDSKKLGFSLIEMMVVVALLGILAAIAYPSYKQHVVKTQRKIAQNQALELALVLEQYRSRNYSYSGVAKNCNSGSNLDVLGAELCSNEHYDVSLEIQNDGREYILTLTPISTLMSGDGKLKFDNFGNSCHGDSCILSSSESKKVKLKQLKKQ